MLLKIYVVLSLACVTFAQNSVDADVAETEVGKFETSHKNPSAMGEDSFHTAHKITPYHLSAFTADTSGDFGGLRFLRSTKNFLPTKERPELNPILSALINEDVRKSIEAKRAIEKEELDAVRAEIDAAVAKAERKEKNERQSFAADKSDANVEELRNTNAVLTTMAPRKKNDLEDDINVGFVDQTISLDTAGTENNKKSRIEIKKGPNGQEYEYEYVYYYEDEDEAKPVDAVVAESEESKLRGKSRYSTIDRSTSATPTENSLVSGKAKGRSSNVEDVVEVERLPAITRFPSRGKNINEVPPTPALDVQQRAGPAVEKKKISVKRPSLELVDSETFNTDEKQAKGSPRNGDTEANKPALALEQEAAAAAAAAAKTAADEIAATAKSDAQQAESEYGLTVPPMEKAAFDLYAILANEKFNNDMTTNAYSNDYATTNLPDTTNLAGDADEESLTTLIQALPSSTTTTTTTTSTTTTEAPTTTTSTTTTSTAKPSLFGRRPGQSSGGRNRFKPKHNNGNAGGDGTTTTSTEAPSEQPKTGKNRYGRPSVGGRSRLGSRTTHAPTPAQDQEEEEKIEVKEVKPASSGFARNRPRNRFNLRGSTTTERHEEAAAINGAADEESVSSTTARTTRSRPTLNLRGRTRATTTKAPAATSSGSEDETVKHAENETEGKPTAAAASTANKPSRFNLNRAGQNRLLPRKFGRTTEAPASEDSAADSSHHNDIKGGGNSDEQAQQQDDAADKADHKEVESAAPATSGLNRLKSRPRLNIQKTEKQKAAPAAPRKINPLLAKRRLQLGSTTTEAALTEDNEAVVGNEENEGKGSTNATADDNDSAKDETTEETETTTKQARGLGLLGQRRRLPLRKPGTIL